MEAVRQERTLLLGSGWCRYNGVKSLGVGLALQVDLTEYLEKRL